MIYVLSRFRVRVSPLILNNVLCVVCLTLNLAILRPGIENFKTEDSEMGGLMTIKNAMNDEQNLYERDPSDLVDSAAIAVPAPEMTLLLLLSWCDRLTLYPQNSQDAHGLAASLRNLEKWGYVRFVHPVIHCLNKGDWELTGAGKALVEARRAAIRQNALCCC